MGIVKNGLVRKEENEYDFKFFLHCLWMKKLLKMSGHSVFYIQERGGGPGTQIDIEHETDRSFASYCDP
jgi:hypothetical protein